MNAYVVTPRDPRRVAGAVVGYQVRQPRFLGVVALAVAGFVIIGAVGAGTGGAIAGLVLAVVVQALVVTFKLRQLTKVLAARGYRPGSIIEAEFTPDTFTISTELGTGIHPYDLVVDAQRVGDVLLLRLGQARIVVAVPMELVPDAAATRLIASRASAARGR